MEEIDENLTDEIVSEFQEDVLDFIENVQTNLFSNNDSDVNGPKPEHLEVLSKCFGHKNFRTLQWQIISSIINDKRDNCAIMTTGYGKSLCYQYPSAYLGGLTIVVSPLISLMEDQVLSLKMSNIPACLLGSAQTKQNTVLEDILSDKYCLVYCTPEFCTGDFGKEMLQRMYRELSITLIAIDEAHCASSWGHDFRFKYRELGLLRKIMPEVPILAVTATATPTVREDIIKLLGLREPQILCSGFDRPNLYLSVFLKSNQGVYHDLTLAMTRVAHEWKFTGSTIIYCITRNETEDVAEILKTNGVQCLPYHAGLSLKLRQETHEKFLKDKVGVIVATIAFGMGIDKPDVRTVIHYGASNSLESYYQEIGRAGRDGLPAQCFAFYTNSDFDIHRKMRESSYGGGGNKAHKEKMAEIMKDYLRSRECRRRYILSYFEDKTCEINKQTKSCCDNCTRMASLKDVDEFEGLKDGKYDFTEDSRMFLAAVNAMNSSFGVSVYILFLRGSKCARVYERFQKHALYGSGLSKSQAWWKGIACMLEAEKYVKKDHIKKNKFSYFTLGLSDKGRQFLNDIEINPSGVKLWLVPPPELTSFLQKPKAKPNEWISVGSSQANSSKPILVEQQEDEQEKEARMKLYRLLLNKRSELATAYDCMPYSVGSNAALMEMAKVKPLSLSELRESHLEGFTEAKLEKFGEEFLDVVRSFCNCTSTAGKQSIRDILIQHPLDGASIGMSASVTFSKFHAGATVEEISTQRGVTPSTIISHLVDAMKVGQPVKMIDLGVTVETCVTIRNVISTLESGTSSFLLIKSACPDYITYDQVKIVCAYLRVRKHLKELKIEYKEFEDEQYENLSGSPRNPVSQKTLDCLIQACKDLENEQNATESQSTVVENDAPPAKKIKCIEENSMSLLDSPPRRPHVDDPPLECDGAHGSEKTDESGPKVDSPVAQTKTFNFKKKKALLPPWLMTKRIA